MEAAAAKAAQLAAERDAQALRARKAEQSYARFYGEAEAADDAGSKDLANEPVETAETVAPAEPAQPLSDFAKQAVGGDS